MTDLVDRPAVAARRSAGYGRRATLTAAMAAAAWAAAMGLVVTTVVVMASWASAGGATSAATALRVSAATWLLCQHVGLAVGPVPSVHLGLVPLGLFLLPVVLLLRAGASVARVVGVRGWRDLWLAVGGLAAAYAAIAGLVAGMTTSVAVRPAPLQSLLVPWATAMVCGTLGAMRQDGLGRAALRRLPAAMTAALRAGTAATALLVAACLAVAVVGMLLRHLDLATTLGQSLHAGGIGDAALLVVNAALLVTAVAWATAYLVGTGFSVGIHTGVSPFGHHLAQVPDLPVLAAVPSGASPGWAPLLIAVPVLAGVIAGWRVAARTRSLPWWQVPLAGLGSGVVAGLLIAAIAALSGGPAGNGRLATLGNRSAWRTGLAAAVEIGVAALLAASARRAAHRYAGLPGQLVRGTRAIALGGQDYLDLTDEDASTD